MPTASASRLAFTLIELSIVLVIIGLLVGGVLSGRELIHTAQVRKQVSQLEQYNTAVNTFANKYNCYPGDCASAAAFGLGAAGDGNGSMNNWDPPNLGASGPASAELQNFWVHLGNSELIAARYSAGATPGTHSPKLVLPGRTAGGIWQSDAYVVTQSVAVGSSANKRNAHAWLLISHTNNSVFSPNSVYSHSDAFMLDSKIDEGLPMTGVVIAMNGYGANSCPNGQEYCVAQAYSTTGTAPFQAGAATSCIDDAGSTPNYNMKNDSCTNASDASCLCGLVIYTRP